MDKVKLAATLLTVVTAATPPACQQQAPPPGSGAPAGGVYDCNTTAYAPTLSTQIHGKVAVEGRTESTCTVAPQQHHVTVFLDLKVAGQWTKQSNVDGRPSANCYDVPGAGGPKTCQWFVLPCQTGTWRTRAIVYGVGPTGKPFTFDVPEMPTAKLTCPKK